MRALFSWLKEFLEVSLHPDALAERLTLAGHEVTGITRAGDDWVLELEITPNRPDLLSHLGLARETAAVLGRKLRVPRRIERDFRPLRQPPAPFPVTIEDPDGCFRYTGVVIEGVKVRPSEPAIAQKLARLGHRPINNIVDVTNFCLHELGQPLHAFDLDKLEGRAIRVRRAAPKETLTTIDGVSRQLPPDALVIADAKRPVALAGVMGGKETEITESTKRVFLESAWFDPVRVRRASRALKLGSDSSYRFERGVDPAMVPMAAMRAARLIAQVSGGMIKGGMIEAGKGRLPRRRIRLQFSRAQELLGMRIYPAQQRRFLERLGCTVTGDGRGCSVEPPSWRPDLRIAEDLYEELARLWGYDRCPATLPPSPRVPVAAGWELPRDPWVELQDRLKQLLAAAGLQEILTYSLVNPQDHERVHSLGGWALALENPLSIDQAVLRNTLRIGALQTVARNLNRKSAESFRLFELGRVFVNDPKSEGPREKRSLSLVAAGTPSPSWGVPSGPLSLFDLKGAIELVCGRLAVPLPSEKAVTADPFFAAPAISLAIDGKELGLLGKVSPETLGAFDIPADFPVAYAEIDLDLIAGLRPVPLRAQPLAKVPPVVRDLALVLPAGATHAEVVGTIREAGRPLLKDVELFDVYHGSQVPAGHKSLAFRLAFSAGDRTLTDDEVAAAHQKIVTALGQRLQASLRT